ncbi:MAG: hypothetical protein HY553_14130 [Elusimicrobia bacterium]|nr:hypothetical protein [Elusimicrobiota bacterium]
MRRSFLALGLLALALTASAATRPPKALPRVRIDDRGSARERRLIEGALERIAATPTAQRLSARQARLPQVTVSFATFSRGAAPLDEAWGRVDYERSALLLNDGLFSSTSYIVITLAHELYGHASIVPESERAGADIGLLMENEAYSLAVGHVISREAGERVDVPELIAALAQGVDAYYDEFVFDHGPDTLQLSLAEAHDPAGSVRARERELARRRRSVEIREKDMAVWAWQLEHFEREHGIARAMLANLRDSLDEWRGTILSGRRKQLETSAPRLRAVLEWFGEPEGRQYVRTMVAVSTHPYAAGLKAELAELCRRLAELMKADEEKPVAYAPSPEPKPYEWEDLQRLVDQDRREHPGHFKDEPSTEPPLPWIQPRPPSGAAR